MQVIKVRYNQTLIDMAMQGTGFAENLFAVALLNGLSVTDDVAVDSDIKTPDFDFKQRSIVTYFNQPSHYPASGITTTTVYGLEGISYWAVGTEFIVQ